MSLWLVVLTGGLLTFAMRFSFIYLLGRLELSEKLSRALRFVPPAVLSAIILPELIMPSGALDLTLRNYRLIAGCLAVIIAWRTKNTLVTLFVGMTALLILQIAFK
jgi:branched-subunit amino acid transport protein